MIDQVYAAFCGTGKSYLCNAFANRCIEFECWKYEEGDFPKNYVEDIKEAIGKYEYIFTSTNPVVLRLLDENGIHINLIYPKKELKSEYFKRFAERDNHIDFVITLNKYWDVWIDELKEQEYCKHLVLNKNEYLGTTLFNQK